MTTITVLDSASATQTVAKVLDTGSVADAASFPVALSTEGKAQLGALTETAPASDTASSGLNGRLQRIAQRLTTLLPVVGTAADAASSPVALSTEGKAQLGAVAETAPASDTASSGLNGRLQRIAQRITSMIALLPAALGQTTKAASLSVALSSNDDAVVALQVLDDWDETDRAKVNVIAGQAGVAAGAGAVGATVQRMTLASDDPLIALCAAPATGTQSNVASSATDVTILASNAARKGFYVHNDSTQILYLLLSNATSSATVFTQKMAAADAFSAAPGTYTGAVKGIWASANGSARVTEWT